MKNRKEFIYRVIQPHEKNDLPSTVFDWSIIFLVVVDIFTTILYTMPMPEQVLRGFDIAEWVTVIVFTVEYLLRLWLVDILYKDKKTLMARLKYLFTFIMFVDLLAIAPFYLQFFIPFNIHVVRVFRLLLILRLLKIKRYSKTLLHIGNVIKRKVVHLSISILILLTLMLVASVLMYAAEHEAQPDVFVNAFSGLWWAVITMTTVGYGDIFPITAIGRMIGAAFSIFSIGIIAIPTGIISVGFLENTYAKKAERAQDKRFCSYCGENIDP